MCHYLNFELSANQESCHSCVYSTRRRGLHVIDNRADSFSFPISSFDYCNICGNDPYRCCCFISIHYCAMWWGLFTNTFIFHHWLPKGWYQDVPTVQLQLMLLTALTILERRDIESNTLVMKKAAAESEEFKNYGISIRLWILIYIKDLLCAIMLSYTYSLTLTA